MSSDKTAMSSDRIVDFLPFDPDNEVHLQTLTQQRIVSIALSLVLGGS